MRNKLSRLAWIVGICTAVIGCAVAARSASILAFKAHNNGVLISYRAPTTNSYFFLIKPSTAVYNDSGYYNPRTGKFTPPDGTNLINLSGQIWVYSGAAQSGSVGVNFVAKVIKNWAVDANGFECTGATSPPGDCPPGSPVDLGTSIGTFGSSPGFTSGLVFDVDDRPSNGDYYGVFIYIAAQVPGKSIIKVDGYFAHTFIQGKIFP